MLVALASSGVLTAAALVPAPPAVLPFVVLVCVGYPMLAALDVPVSIAVLRATGGVARRRDPLDALAFEELRRRIDDLPETQHPLGY